MNIAHSFNVCGKLSSAMTTEISNVLQKHLKKNIPTTKKRTSKLSTEKALILFTLPLTQFLPGGCEIHPPWRYSLIPYYFASKGGCEISSFLGKFLVAHGKSWVATFPS